MRPIKDTLLLALAAVQENFKTLLTVWAATGLIPQGLGLLMRLARGLNDAASLQQALDSRDFGVVGPLALIGLVGMILGFLGYLATVIITARGLQGHPATAGEALGGAYDRSFAAAGASLIAGVAVLAGCVALVIPGLYLMVRLSLTVCSATLEGSGPVKAVSRSWALIAGRFWPYTLRLVAYVGVAVLGAVVLGLAERLVGTVLSVAGGLGDAVAALVSSAAQFILSAWVTACVTRTFMDLAEASPAEQP